MNTLRASALAPAVLSIIALIAVLVDHRNFTTAVVIAITALTFAVLSLHDR